MNPNVSSDEVVDCLVVGAGLAGLAFAGDAKAAGKTVCVLDKGRGVGGRMATRRLGSDGVRVDHGAQFFTARGSRLQKMVETGLSDGTIIEWSRGFPLWKNGAITTRPPGHPRYACPNGMSEIAKQLSRDLHVQTGAQITGVSGNPDGGYVATDADGRTFAGRTLLLCLPPEQLLKIARPLLPVETVEPLEAVVFDPAWTLIAQLESDLPGVDFPAVEFENHPVLGWMSRDHTKRKGPNVPPILVVHGSGKWSQEHLEDAPADVQTALLDALADVFGPIPPVVQAQTHRWRYANPTHSLGRPFFWDAQTRIGGGGDWATGGRVEGALTSGWELAEEVLG